MLVRIYPQQLTKFLSLVDYVIAESFGFKGKTELKLFNTVKEKLIKGIMHFWVCYNKEEVIFAVLTSISVEPDTERRLLTIYAIKAFQNATVEDFKDSLATLTDFAKSERIDVLQAFYIDERITSLIHEVSPSHKIKYYVEMEV